jgi:hypothetical protein
MGHRGHSSTGSGMFSLSTKGGVRSMCYLIEGTTRGSGTRRGCKLIVVDFGIGSVTEPTTIGSRPITRRMLHIDRLFVIGSLSRSLSLGKSAGGGVVGGLRTDQGGCREHERTCDAWYCQGAVAGSSW